MSFNKYFLSTILLLKDNILELPTFITCQLLFLCHLVIKLNGDSRFSRTFQQHLLTNYEMFLLLLHYYYNTFCIIYMSITKIIRHHVSYVDFNSFFLLLCQHCLSQPPRLPTHSKLMTKWPLNYYINKTFWTVFVLSVYK